MAILNFARYQRKPGGWKQDWTDQEIAEFFRVCDALGQAGLSIVTDRGVTDEGDPWFVFVRAATEEVIAHFARIDGEFVADSSALESPVSGRDLRAVLNQTFRHYTLISARPDQGGNLFMHPAALLTAFVATAFFQIEHGSQGFMGAAKHARGEGATPEAKAAGANVLDKLGGEKDGGDKAGLEKADEGLKALLSRLPAIFGNGASPANAPGRAVSFSDSNTSSDASTSSSVLMTTLVVALTALHGVEAAAQEADAPAQTQPLPDAVAVPLDHDAGGTRGYQRASVQQDGAFDGGNTDPVEIAPAVRAADLPEIADANGSLSVSPPQSAAQDGAEGGAAHLASAQAETALPIVPVDPTPENGGPTTADALAEGEAADAEAAEKDAADTAEETQDEATSDTQAETPGGPESDEAGEGALSTLVAIYDLNDTAGRPGDESESAREALPSVAALLSSSDGEPDPSLAAIVDYIQTQSQEPEIAYYNSQTLLGQVSDAFMDADGGRPNFVIFESDDIDPLGFAFMPNVVFLKESALDGSRVSLDAPETDISLLGGDSITLKGVVSMNDGSVDLFL